MSRSTRQIGILTLLMFTLACEDSSSTGELTQAPTSDSVRSQSAQLDSTLVVFVDFAGDADELPKTATVYVFARAVGSRMPYAVERCAPTELPKSIGFSKPQGEQRRVEVVARLSLSGEVMKQPEDPQIISEAVDIVGATSPLRLTIPVGSSQRLVAVPPSKIQTRVTLMPDVAVSESARLFIIAKSANTSIPLPIAVKAYDIHSIPKLITLTDADVLSSTVLLSTQQQIALHARISQSGETQRRPGDWESDVQSLVLGSNEIATLNLSKLVE